MGSPGGLHEHDFLRVSWWDVLTMLVLLELSITPALSIGLDGHIEWLVPWLLVLLGVGVVLPRVDEQLVPYETKLRRNDWGLAVIDRRGRVTRSFAWHALTAFRLDRCLDGPLCEEILVLVLQDRELSIGSPWAWASSRSMLRCSMRSSSASSSKGLLARRSARSAAIGVRSAGRGGRSWRRSDG
jgi:hypothetical protein